jgi:ribosomal protein S18 acetylase RimI-like enzyme
MEKRDFNDLENRTEGLKVVIEKASIADLEIIQKLNQELCTKENQEFDETIDPDYPFSEKGEEYFRSRIESADGLTLLAKEGAVVVGYLVGGMVEPEDYRTVNSIAELENMYVQESMRGKGVGGKLMSQFEDWCKERKVQIIRVVASAANIDAIKFYETHGSKKVSLTLEKNLDQE